jgi:hypothetical protein
MQNPNPLIVRKLGNVSDSVLYKLIDLHWGNLKAAFLVRHSKSSWYHSERPGSHTGGELIFLDRRDSRGQLLALQLRKDDVVIQLADERCVVTEVTSGETCWESRELST